MMNKTNFQKVGEFMRAYEQDVHTTARFPMEKIRQLRFDLIEEELDELNDAMKKQEELEAVFYKKYGLREAPAIDDPRGFKEFFSDSDAILIEIADALTDLLYVIYGAGHAYGIDLDACFDEVQRSNMSKLDENGKAIKRKDGKILKGPNYSPPNLRGIVKF